MFGELAELQLNKKIIAGIVERLKELIADIERAEADLPIASGASGWRRATCRDLHKQASGLHPCSGCSLKRKLGLTIEPSSERSRTRIIAAAPKRDRDAVEIAASPPRPKQHRACDAIRSRRARDRTERAAELMQANLRLVVSLARRRTPTAVCQFLDLDPGGQHRPDEGDREVRLQARLQAVDLRDLVDPPADHPRDLGSGAHHSHSRAHASRT